jgi:hypothetical protein
MTNVRLYVNNKPAQLISSVVERNGTRAIDSGKFQVTRKTAVTKGDLIQYVQDVVPPTYLAGVWNMELSTRDESGYNIDGDETTSGKHDGEFKIGADGYYWRNDNTGTKCIKIPHDSHLDLSQQFDIMIMVRYIKRNSSNSGTLEFNIWGKGNSTNSISLSAPAGAGTYDPIYPKVTMIVNGSTTTITGTTDMNYRNVTVGSGNMSHWRWLRVKRDENNLVTLMSEDTIQGTATVAGDFSPNSDSAPLYIGGDKSGANLNYYSTGFALTKFYSGGYLSDEQWDTVRSARRPTQIMKFGGTVWKIDEKPSYKMVHCKSLADKLHNIEINKDLAFGLNWTTGDPEIIKNEYFGKKGYEILEDLFKVYDVGIEFIVKDSSNVNETYDHYHAVGTLISNVQLLIMNGATDESFHISPRGTLIMEDDDLSHSNILFKSGTNGVQMKDFGYDDSNVITELTLISGNSIIERTYTLNVSSWSTTFDSLNGYAQNSNKMFGKPIAIEVTDPDGLVLTRLGDNQGTNLWDEQSGAAGTNQYKVNYHDKSIWLGTRNTSSGSYKIKYTYENKFDTNKYYTGRHSTYSTLGAFSKTMNIPQFMGVESLTNLATRIFAKSGDIERRVTIEVPTLVNHVRENYEVKVEDPSHGVGTTGSPIDLSVKSMKFYYPQGQTIIDCGEHQLDSYDLDKSFGEAISTSKAVIIRSP